MTKGMGGLVSANLYIDISTHLKDLNWMDGGIVGYKFLRRAMRRLTIEQRAQRAAKRINNKLAKTHPLFTEQFAVSVESQVERLTRLDAGAEKAFEFMRQNSCKAWERGLRLRAVIADLAPNDFDEYEQRYQRIYGTRGKYSEPEYAGANLADWWWQAVKVLVPVWAQANCPNGQFHEWKIYKQSGKCPTCRKKL